MLSEEYSKLYGSCVHIVRPSNWYPDDIDQMDVDERTDWQIAAWEHALEKCCSLLATKDVTNVILFDTCGASPNALKTLIGVAQLHRHRIVAIWMAVPRRVCESRIEPSVVQRYVDRIHNAVQEYKATCDELIVVKHDTLDNWRCAAREISPKIKQEQSILSRHR